jgi:hypothetical protein
MSSAVVLQLWKARRRKHRGKWTLWRVGNHVSQAVEGVRDTPINRATVSQLTTEALEKELDAIRERRLAMRIHIEKLAKIKGDKADLTSFLKFDKLLKKVTDDMKKWDAKGEEIQQAVNKLTSLVIEMGE